MDYSHFPAQNPQARTKTQVPALRPLSPSLAAPHLPGALVTWQVLSFPASHRVSNARALTPFPTNPPGPSTLTFPEGFPTFQALV